jgi:hypothetical protein
MKKYKLYFSIFNAVQETQKEITRLQVANKTLMAALLGTSFISGSHISTFIIAAVGASIDFILSCCWLEEINGIPEKQ